MFNIVDYININKTLIFNKEKFSMYMNGGGDDNKLSKGIIIASILLNMVFAFLFIQFSLDYINVIDPKLTIQNKSIYIILVYLLLISNAFMFLLSLVNLSQVLF